MADTMSAVHFATVNRAILFDKINQPAHYFIFRRHGACPASRRRAKQCLTRTQAWHLFLRDISHQRQRCQMIIIEKPSYQAASKLSRGNLFHQLRSYKFTARPVLAPRLDNGAGVDESITFACAHASRGTMPLLSRNMKYLLLPAFFIAFS